MTAMTPRQQHNRRVNEWVKVIVPIILVAMLGWVATMESTLKEVYSIVITNQKYIEQTNNNLRRIEKIEDDVTMVYENSSKNSLCIQRISDNQAHIRETSNTVNNILKTLSETNISLSKITFIQSQLLNQHPSLFFRGGSPLDSSPNIGVN